MRAGYIMTPTPGMARLLLLRARAKGVNVSDWLLERAEHAAGLVINPDQQSFYASRGASERVFQEHVKGWGKKLALEDFL